MKTKFALGLCVLGLVSVTHAQLFSDNFTRGSYAQGLTSPWATNSGFPGVWSVMTNAAGGGGVLQGGPNAGTSYGIAYVATNTWTNYSVSAKIQFSANNIYGGGLGGRLNAANGSRYAAWVFPEFSSAALSNEVRLIKFYSWGGFDFVTPALPVASVGTNQHTLRLDFSNAVTRVYFDGLVLTNFTDAAATNLTGGISVDMWSDPAGYTMLVDDVAVTNITAAAVPPVANNDAYSPVTGKLLTVAAPGVLGNDSGGSGPLKALIASFPIRGTLSFATNGGFTYTATNGYTGADSFTYRAADSAATSGVATVSLSVVANSAPVGVADGYSLPAGQLSTVSAPGVLGNDSDVNGDVLTAVLVATTTNGSLSLSANGGFTYTPTGSYLGPDAFTYRANDGSSNSAITLVSITVLTPGVLLTDNFTRSPDNVPLVTPWATNNGNWLVSGGVLRGGTNAAFNYGYAYVANTWSNYSVSARVRFSNSNAWGGGLGGRLGDSSPSGGAHYGAWLYPDASAGGSNVLVLIKFATWTSFTPMATIPVGSVGTNFHTIKLSFAGDQIGVSYDGVLQTNVVDGSGPIASGGITADMWTDSTAPYSMSVDDVAVNLLVVDDFYSATSGTALSRTAATGVLTNDTGVSGGALAAVLVSGPANGILTLTNNGGFSYTATNGFVGPDSFVYQANDGAVNLGRATVSITVGASGPAALFYSEFFDGVTAPALPSGWTTSAGGGLSGWVTTNTLPDTAPNAAFSPDPAVMGSNALTSPVIALPGGLSRLVFDHSYNLEDDAGGGSFDGGILEIKIGAGAFTDILAAGGSFVTNGYNRTISTNFDNPFKGQLAWGGDSSGYDETVVNLPAAAAGQSIQLRWRCGTDTGNGVPVTGWRVDTVRITNCLTAVCWNTPPLLPAQTNRTIVELTALSVTNTATQADVPTNTVAYSLLTAPSGATINTNTGIITWTPTEPQGPSTNTFRTRVVDTGSPPLSFTNIFTVTVTETNDNTPAFTLPNLTNFSSVELSLFTVTNSATDADVPANTLTYSLLTFPTGATINTNTGVITWTPTEAQGPSLSNVFQTRVVDNGSPARNATNTFYVSVTETNNNAPGFSLPNLTNYTLVELTTFTVTNSATDGDVPANALTYSLLSSPTGATINTNTGVIIWVPTEAQGPSVSNVFQTRVTDNGTPARNTTNTFYVSVTETNDNAPVLAVPNLTNYNAVELSTFTVTNSATDGDVPANILAYSLLAFPTGATINTNTGVITWMPTEAQGPSVSNLFQTVVVDNGVPARSATNTFYVTVTETNNNAPVFALPNLTNYGVAELTVFTVTNSATDGDVPANTLTYSLLTFPTGATINTNTGAITWTPGEAQGPTVSNVFQTRVTDNGLPALNTTNVFYVSVTEVNTGPGATNFSVTTPEDTATNLVLQGGDADLPANLLVYAILTGPTNGSLGTLNVTNGAVTYTPNANFSGADAIRYTVSDGALSATGLVSVTVASVNDAPVATSFSVTTPEDTATNLVLLGSDVDNANLTYAILTGPTNGSLGTLNETNGAVTYTPNANYAGADAIQFTVSDGALSATGLVSVTVTSVNDAPVATSFSVTTPEDTATNLVLLGSDVDTANLTYAILTGPTNGSLGTLNTTNGAVTYTPNANYVGPDAIQFTVSDGALSATGLVSVTVSPVNDAPVLPSQTNRTIATLIAMTVTNTATDIDLPANTLNYTLLIAPTNAAIDADGVITWTPTAGQGGSTNTITTVVTDNGTPPLSATNTFIVVVSASAPADPPPVIQSIVLSNDLATVTWSAVVTRSYRLQSITNIDLTNWADVGAEIIASGATASQTNSVIGEPEKFYRVRMAP